MHGVNEVIILHLPNGVGVGRPLPSISPPGNAHVVGAPPLPSAGPDGSQSLSPAAGPRQSVALACRAALLHLFPTSACCERDTINSDPDLIFAACTPGAEGARAPA